MLSCEVIIISNAQSISVENLEISKFLNSSIFCAKDNEEEKGFSEEEKRIMTEEYLGNHLNSKYYSSVKSYLSHPSGYINLGKKDMTESVLISMIITHIGHKLGMNSYDKLFGNSSREDLIEIIEDTFIKCLSTYTLSRDKNLKTELNKKILDSNYVIDFKIFKSFNAYIYKSIGRELLRFTKKPGEYGPDVEVIDNYTLIDSEGNKTEVSKKRIEKGEYVVDKTRSPLELSLVSPSTHSEEENLVKGETSETTLYDSKHLLCIDNGYDDVFNAAHINLLRKVFDDIFEKLTWEEKILLRNIDEYCEIYGKRKLKQNEIAKILDIKQGTVSKNIGNLCFKITNEIFKRGYDYDENSFK